MIIIQTLSVDLIIEIWDLQFWFLIIFSLRSSSLYPMLVSKKSKFSGYIKLLKPKNYNVCKVRKKFPNLFFFLNNQSINVLSYWCVYSFPCLALGFYVIRRIPFLPSLYSLGSVNNIFFLITKRFHVVNRKEKQKENFCFWIE